MYISLRKYTLDKKRSSVVYKLKAASRIVKPFLSSLFTNSRFFFKPSHLSWVFLSPNSHTVYFQFSLLRCKDNIVQDGDNADAL